METVKMVTRVAGEEVFVGECHPARARVLVKKQLASWVDGKVLLHVLNVHDKLLASNPEAARGPLDDNNVSKQEMERRLAWFRAFMEKSSRALIAGSVELPTVEEVAARQWQAPPRLSDAGRTFIKGPLFGRVQSFFTESRSWDDRAVFIAEVRKSTYDEVLTQMSVEGADLVDAWQEACDLVDDVQLEALPDDEVEAFFTDEGASVDPVDHQVWESAPDVSGVFGPSFEEHASERAEHTLKSLFRDGVVVTPSDDRLPLPEPVADRLEAPPFDQETYRQQRERDARIFAAERASLEDSLRQVATVRQVLAVHNRTPSGAVRVRLASMKSE